MIKFEKTNLLGIYLYLRQLEMSIDRRMKLKDFEDVKNFFAIRTSPSKVVDFLRKKSGLNQVDLSQNENTDLNMPEYNSNIIVRTFRRYFLPNSLFKVEVIYTVFLLECVLKFFQNPNNESDVADLRYRLRLCYETIYTPLFPASDRKKVQDIEHLNQADFIKYKKLEEILGTSWLSR